MTFKFPTTATTSDSHVSLSAPRAPGAPLFLFDGLSAPITFGPSFSVVGMATPTSVSPLQIPVAEPSGKIDPVLISVRLPSLVTRVRPPLPV